MSEIKIVAMPDPAVEDLHGNDMDAQRQDMLSTHQALGYQFIPSFSSVAELISTVRAIVAAHQACLRELEIQAHGNPQCVDGITLANAAQIAGQLKTITLCDVVDVYLSGCNTGVQLNGAESVAQVFSRHTPTQAADNVRVIVHGSVGYKSGSHAQRNESCTTTCTTGTGKDKTFWDAYPPTGNQPGSQAGTGATTWRAWVEGVPQ